MTTSFHLRPPSCDCCGHQRCLLIGNSAVGWAFALRVYTRTQFPTSVLAYGELPYPTTLAEWQTLLEAVPSGSIRDQYGKKLSAAQMMSIITRGGQVDLDPDSPSYPEALKKLQRWPLDSFVRRGSGPWDEISRDFG
jgi:hypothetical protein